MFDQQFLNIQAVISFITMNIQLTLFQKTVGFEQNVISSFNLRS